ncbi:MAG: hypothetical protein IKM51_00920, partial [Oscillospiraceae bacterium]|nr:hypothetical protein [Oscillospiraceae bacterium]
ENIELTAPAAKLLASMADGALRDALSLLDQCASAGTRVDEDRVREATGMAPGGGAVSLIECAAEGDLANALKTFEKMYASGAVVSSLMDEISALLRDVMMLKVARGATLSYPIEEERLIKLAKKLPGGKVMDMLELVRECQSRARYSTDRKVDAQLCLMQLCLGAKAGSGELLERIERLEKMVKEGARAVPAKEEEYLPWDEADIPAPPPEYDAPPVFEAPVFEQPPLEEPPVIETVSFAEPEENIPAVSADQSGFDWFSVLEKVKNDINFGDYTNLINPSMVSARLVGETLCLGVDNEFVRMRLEDPKLGMILAKAAGAVNTSVSLGLGSKTEDKFEELLSLGGRFDNIKVE